MKISISIIFAAIFITLSMNSQAQIASPNPFEGKTRSIVEEAAKNGDPSAQYQWATRLFWDDLDGRKTSEEYSFPEEDITKRLALAKPWYEKAAKNGFGDAYSDLATFVVSYEGDDRDIEKGTRYLEKGIALGSNLAKLNYGVWHIEDEERGPRALGYLEGILKIPSRESDFGIPAILFEVYTYKIAGQEYQPKKALEYGKECVKAETENVSCLFLLGRYYKNGWAGDAQPEKALVLFRRAAVQGHARSEWLVGMAYLNGEGVVRNEVTAYQWVEKAALQDDAQGMISAAVMNALGEGTKVNPQKAFEWYEKAARNGSHHALRGLGFMMVQGDGRAVDTGHGWAAVIIASEGDEIAMAHVLDKFPNYINKEKIIKEEFSKPIAEMRKKYGF